MSSTSTSRDVPTFEEYAVSAWPSLYRSAYLLAGQHADAEDLAQQTLMKAHRAWARVCRAESPHAYVRRILTNTYLSAQRPQKRRLEVLTDAPPEGISDHGAGPETRLLLWPHVSRLPPRQRAVVVLRYYEDLGEAEIADALGCSRGTVKSTAHRALKALRAAMDRDDTEGRET